MEKSKHSYKLNPSVELSCEHARKHDYRIRKAKNDLIALILNAKEGEIITIPDDICKEVRVWWDWEKRKALLHGKPLHRI